MDFPTAAFLSGLFVGGVVGVGVTCILASHGAREADNEQLCIECRKMRAHYCAHCMQMALEKWGPLKRDKSGRFLKRTDPDYGGVEEIGIG